MNVCGQSEIQPGTPEFSEARHLLAKFKQHEETGKKQTQAAVAKARYEDIAGRKKFIRVLEDNFLKSGMDVSLSTSGPNGTTLNFKYVLLSRPFLYKIYNETSFLEQCRNAGFRKIYFTDGYGKSASYDLLNEQNN